MNSAAYKEYLQYLDKDNKLRWLEKERARIMNLDRTIRMTFINGEWHNTTYMDPRIEEINRMIDYRREQIQKHYYFRNF